MKALSGLTCLIQKGGLWLFFGHGFTLLGQFALIKYIAAFGSKAIFGQFAITMLVVAGFATLFFGPLIQWVLRHYQEFFEHNREQEYYLVVFYVLLAFFALLLLLSFVVVPVSYLEDYGIGKSAQILTVCLAFLVCVNELISSIFNASGHIRYAAVFFMAGTWSRVAGAAIVLGFLSGSYELMLVSISVLQLTLALLQLFFLLRIRKGVISLRLENKARIAVHFRRMKSYLWPFLIWSIPGYAALMGDRWILTSYLDVEALAEYAAMAFVTIGVSNALGVAFNKAAGPIIFRVSGGGANNQRRSEAKGIINNLTLVLAAGYVAVTVFYYLWPNFFITMFTSSGYVKYAQYLWVMMLASVLFNLSQFLVTHGLVDKSPRIYLMPKVIHGVVVLACLLWFVPRYTVLGAVMALLIGNVLQLILVLYVNWKQDVHRVS